MTVTIDTTTQRFTSGPQPEADVCVVHTTEGMNWPGYSGGGEAPHATIWPLPGVGIKVREHIPTTQYAKALMNLPGGVETNRRGVLQYELVGTCVPSHFGVAGWYFWPAADPVVLAALADYLRPILARYKIPHVAPAFQPYSASYGARTGTNKVRMSAATWNTFNGICGHQHVPEIDMPLTAQEITAVSQAAANETWNRFTVNGLTLTTVLSRLLAQGDPSILAAAVVKAMPAAITTGNVAVDPAVLQAAIDKGLRVVFADAAVK